MTITNSLKASNVALNRVSGAYVDSAGTPGLLAITVGFVPSKVRFVNLTDRTQYEWVAGNANGTTLKTVNTGTVTLDTGDAAISVDSAVTGTAPVQLKADTVVTIAAAVILQNKANFIEIIE